MEAQAARASILFSIQAAARFCAAGGRPPPTRNHRAIYSTSSDALKRESCDGNENGTATGGRTFAYDSQNELIAVNGGAVRLVCDGDGNRVEEVANGSTTQYLVDDLNPAGYAQVVEETVNGAAQREYTYGLQRIDEDQVIQGAWTPSFYGYDGFGSVRQLTNASGAVTDTWEYDAFGNVLNNTGSTPNNYLYRGEQFDPDLGLYYLRARYYNPHTGRFMSRDPHDGPPFDAKNLHTYLYADGDPVNGFDPTGKDDIDEYDVLTNKYKGSGLQAHHIIPQRFAGTLGALYCTIAVELTPAAHLVFTELWRNVLPYGGTYTVAQIFAAAEEIYWGFPNIAAAASACAALAGP